MLDIDNKDLGLGILGIIAIVWIITSAFTTWDIGTVVHDIVIAIAGIVTGSAFTKKEEKK